MTDQKCYWHDAVPSCQKPGNVILAGMRYCEEHAINETKAHKENLMKEYQLRLMHLQRKHQYDLQRLDKRHTDAIAEANKGEMNERRK